MQHKNFITAILLILFVGSVFGQKLHKSQVPSVIINNFYQQFPKAMDVEWKLEKSEYVVDFETGIRFYDHTIWYDKTGKILRHKEEIPSSQLPAAVSKTLKDEFKGYYTSDITRYTNGKKITYSVEMKKLSEEWKVNIDSEGKIISTKYD